MKRVVAHPLRAGRAQQAETLDARTGKKDVARGFSPARAVPAAWMWTGAPRSGIVAHCQGQREPRCAVRAPAGRVRKTQAGFRAQALRRDASGPRSALTSLWRPRAGVVPAGSARRGRGGGLHYRFPAQSGSERAGIRRRHPQAPFQCPARRYEAGPLARRHRSRLRAGGRIRRRTASLGRGLASPTGACRLGAGPREA